MCCQQTVGLPTPISSEGEPEQQTTLVIFRRWRSGDREVIAVFPEVPASYLGSESMSYLHHGQHGGCFYPQLVRDTRAATPAEYADLKHELEQIGYTLDVRSWEAAAMR